MPGILLSPKHQSLAVLLKIKKKKKTVSCDNSKVCHYLSSQSVSPTYVIAAVTSSLPWAADPRETLA